MNTAMYTSDNMSDYIISTFCRGRLDKKFNTIARHTDVNADHDSICKWLSKNFILFEETAKKRTIGIGHDGNTAFRMHDKNWAISLTFIGDPEQVAQLIKQTRETFFSNPCYVRWVYDPQYMEDVTLPVNTNNLPMQEMYPFMDETLENYYDRYINSSANILVLIGPPGTGKTTFIRGLLSHTKKSATLTYHSKILEQDSFFVGWLESDDTFMILEDSDNLLLPRKEGNDMMSRFLNMGDGLIGFTNKKIIFSTNLPNVSDIDDALTRPGRCFDIMKFRPLDRQESGVLCNRIGIAQPDGDAFTVSELFAEQRNEFKKKSVKRSFGFV